MQACGSDVGSARRHELGTKKGKRALILTSTFSHWVEAQGAICKKSNNQAKSKHCVIHSWKSQYPQFCPPYPPSFRDIHLKSGIYARCLHCFISLSFTLGSHVCRHPSTWSISGCLCQKHENPDEVLIPTAHIVRFYTYNSIPSIS